MCRVDGNCNKNSMIVTMASMARAAAAFFIGFWLLDILDSSGHW
jgi:hypothetical protein